MRLCLRILFLKLTLANTVGWVLAWLPLSPIPSSKQSSCMTCSLCHTISYSFLFMASCGCMFLLPLGPICIYVYICIHMYILTTVCTYARYSIEENVWVSSLIWKKDKHIDQEKNSNDFICIIILLLAVLYLFITHRGRIALAFFVRRW